MNTLGTASVAALRQYVRAAHARGIDTGSLFTKAGLDSSILQTDDGRLNGEQFQAFIRLLVEETNNSILGLETGDYVQPGSYSVLGYITMSCATLGEAVTRIAPFEKLVGDMGTTHLTASGDHINLTWACNYTDPVVRPHMVDNVFASWIHYARWLADNDTASPVEVHLEHPSPGPELESAYTKRWGCPVRFGAGEDTIILHKSLLNTPLRQPDPLLRKTLEVHALSQLASLETDTALTTRVKHSIRNQLMHGITRQDMVADHLGMTSRTLQRKLSQEGVTYQQLLDEVRQAMAEDFLANSTLGIPEIALRLGYSETTSFHRKFKAETGKTPGEFRQLNGS
ncbi:AraC family transcriptional regulator [Marinobacter panjinensis]|uniref:AraC family transcriptional regulator n=1 Tax=Marinobacter panjinensis TaxID=2576384 RepID=A0A4U6R2K0_9GAMM|nr:AraC family transcriptional regulator [Marinobacter panjinensis]MCR8913744.1 AraC family transcriptional regulator [Marinobacter panjinensis]TKV67611.1 AraC family transcriptional regulator [Marinobacter panjinensis]